MVVHPCVLVCEGFSLEQLVSGALGAEDQRLTRRCTTPLERADSGQAEPRLGWETARRLPEGLLGSPPFGPVVN